MTDTKRATALLRDSLREVQRLRAKLKEAEAQAAEPIAVIGVACRTPGGVDSPEAYWELLDRGGDAIGPLPARWSPEELYDPDPAAVGKSYVRAAGSLCDVASFDASFFGITPREAVAIDPQQRLALELSWEAVERAGVDPTSLRGSATGVYIGATISDYLSMSEIRTSIDGYALTGMGPSVIAGRVSYTLGLRGPTMTVDTACSSSLVAVHLACAALRQGECDLALAGGVQVMCSGTALAAFSRLRVASEDGRCKAFAASADGAGWSEGCGLLVLKRLSAARRDGDTVLALVRGSAVNHDGRSQGLTAPNGPSQQLVLRNALRNGGLAPGDIDAVEAHGTGTRLGDPIEAGALTAVFGAGRSAERPLYLGSCKSNIGHTQSAAGVLGLIKMVLALEHGRLPRTLHAETPTAEIDWGRSGLSLLHEPLPWPRTPARPRRAGVSSFGISGTNAHVVIEEAGQAPEEPTPAVSSASAPLLLSGRDEASLRAQATSWSAWLAGHPEVSWPAVISTAATRRGHLDARAALLVDSREGALEVLDALAQGEEHDALFVHHARQRREVVFVFPGQGSQWPTMARQLLAESEAFASSVDACDAALLPHIGWSVRDALRGEPGADAPPLGRVDAVQTMLFAMAIGLAAVWRELGVRPTAVVGHSQGEIAAAVVAGALTLGQGAKIVATRARLLCAYAGSGGMAFIALPAEEIERRIARLRGPISVAVVNTPSSTVVAGDSDALERLMIGLRAEEVFCRRVEVDYASHCAHMDGLVAPITDALRGLSPSPSEALLVSSVTGDAIDGTSLTGAYWARNLREPVRFDRALETLLGRGHDVFVEVSPHPLLTLALEDACEDGAVVGTLRRDHGGLGDVRRSLASLHTHGFEVDWGALLPPAPMVRLPSYPFQRQRFWPSAPSAPQSPAATRSPAAVKSLAGPKTPRPQSHRSPEELKMQHEEAILREIATNVSEVTGLPASGLDTGVGLIRLGVDSMMILQLKNAVRSRFGVQLPSKLFFDGRTSIRTLAAHVAAAVPQAPEPAELTTGALPIADGSVERRVLAAEGGAAAGEVAQVMAEQLAALSELTRRQLETLANLGLTGGQAPPRPIAAPASPRSQPPREGADPKTREDVLVPFVPFRPIQRGGGGATSVEVLQELTQAYCEPTAISKERTQADRLAFANNRNIAGFTPEVKEMTYQIIAERASGSRIWDVDGNEYIDLTMGFGSSLLGHDHPALSAAIKAQMERTWAVGPISSGAGEVARRLCAMTGLERVAFYNSGTEAIMVALRLARTATGRSKIVLFEGSYHGMSDSVLAIPRRMAGPGVAAPMAPGVPESMVQDTVILRYDDPEALAYVEEHAGELAAVLVEPVQSRRPDVQPRGFLQALRELTARLDVALIFDEVVTGFRTMNGGAQAWFGVRADLAAYGKVVGGGMPVGIVAGVARFMDGVDGGMWRYGDDSCPDRINTFVAGTFCSHPLSMASACAILGHLRDEGPALQQRLNARTRSLCARLNTIFADEGLPAYTVHFGSLFRFMLPRAYELLFYRLVAEGIYVWEGRNCFLSTAHTDADIERVIEVVRGAARWLSETVAPALAPEDDTPTAALGVRHSPASMAQRAMFQRCRRAHGDRAYHVRVAWRVEGPLRLERLEPALSELVRRHESLRTCFVEQDDGALLRRVHPVGDFELIHEQIDEKIDEGALPALFERVFRPFDLATPSLLRCAVAELGENDSVLVIDAHHLLVDGVSLGLLVQELLALYDNQPLPPVTAQYDEFVGWEQDYLSSDQVDRDGSAWRRLLPAKLPSLDFRDAQPPEAEAERTFECELASFELADVDGLRRLARERGVTMNALLHAIFQVFLWSTTDQEDLCYGSPTAGRPSERFDGTIGLFIGVVVYRARLAAGTTFTEVIDAAHEHAVRAFELQHYPFARLSEDLGAGLASRPLFEVGFSYEATRLFARTQGEEISLTPIDLPPRSASMDLVLECLDDGASLRMRFAFNPRRYSSALVHDWCALFQRLGSRVLVAAEQPLSELREKTSANVQNARS